MNTKAEVETVPCPTCNGTGYVLSRTYPRGVVLCDECQNGSRRTGKTIASHDDAKALFAGDMAGGCARARDIALDVLGLRLPIADLLCIVGGEACHGGQLSKADVVENLCKKLDLNACEYLDDYGFEEGDVDPEGEESEDDGEDEE